MSAYTPGPWHRNIKPARKYCTIFAGRNTHVANLCTSGLTDEEIEANCDLIAAAPDLLKGLRAAWQTHSEKWWEENAPEAHALILAAIAKAEPRA